MTQAVPASGTAWDRAQPRRLSALVKRRSRCSRKGPLMAESTCSANALRSGRRSHQRHLSGGLTGCVLPATKSHSPAASIGHQGDRCTPATGRSTGVAERLGPTMRASIGSHPLDNIPGSSEVRIHAEQNGNCARTVIEALIDWAEWAEMRRQILGDASTR
jgi:hypothetical protein